MVVLVVVLCWTKKHCKLSCKRRFQRIWCCPGVVSSQKVHVKPHVCVQVTLVPRREVERAVKSCVKTYKDSRLLCREVDMCDVLSSSNHTSHPTPTPKLSKKKKSARSKSKQDTLVKSKRNRDIYIIFCPKSKRNWCLPILLWFYYHFSPPDSTSTPPPPPPPPPQPQSNAI